MPIDPILKQTLAKYQQNKFLLAFAWLRSLHAAYQQIEPLVPPAGNIIDVGCGYGFFSNYIGLKSAGRKVTGLEINKRKLRQCDKDIENVQFKDVFLETFSNSSADTIIFYHVLHHLRSYEDQERLLKTALRILKPEGLLIIIEVAEKPLWKYWAAWWVDHLLYLGDRIFYRTKKDMLKLLEGDLLLNVENFPCDRFAPFSHIAYLASRSAIWQNRAFDAK